ncbi:GNAT family N-acetyltransferase [Halomonas sp. H5]|uniref:GNAT family N-acetyltransferase n=1 Tax=Halomonas sp. H5 TaxID=3423910 RepID=UPI003D36E53F
MTITLRSEQPGDIEAIDRLTRAAFLEAPHTDHTEHLIVAALRDAGALTLSLVAEEDGRLVGQVAISPVTLSDGTGHWYGLGPISLWPERQGQGIGAHLMRRVLAELEALGASGCVVLGDPGYYGRFGFAPVAGLTLPGVPPAYFQALAFAGPFPRGEVSYHPGFAAGTE